jgi:hypothetical protein
LINLSKKTRNKHFSINFQVFTQRSLLSAFYLVTSHTFNMTQNSTFNQSTNTITTIQWQDSYSWMNWNSWIEV